MVLRSRDRDQKSEQNELFLTKLEECLTMNFETDAMECCIDEAAQQLGEDDCMIRDARAELQAIRDDEVDVDTALELGSKAYCDLHDDIVMLYQDEDRDVEPLLQLKKRFQMAVAHMASVKEELVEAGFLTSKRAKHNE